MTITQLLGIKYPIFQHFASNNLATMNSGLLIYQIKFDTEIFL